MEKEKQVEKFTLLSSGTTNSVKPGGPWKRFRRALGQKIMGISAIPAPAAALEPFNAEAPMAEQLANGPVSIREAPGRKSEPPGTTEPAARASDPTESEIVEMLDVNADVNQELSGASSDEYATKVNNTLFGPTAWAMKIDGSNRYDIHMKDTGHDDAAANVIRQAFALDRNRVNDGKPPVFSGNILEMSCGTGTTIKMVYENVPEEARAGIRFTANDLSPDMQDIAKGKLSTVAGANVDYIRQDLRDLNLPPGTVHAAMFCQTLHLLTQPELLIEEGRAEFTRGSSEHREVKIEVIKKAFAALEDRGWFMLIDEWSPTITRANLDRPLTRQELKTEMLFLRTFRPILDRGTIWNHIMRKVPGARFVAELKAPIDKHHSMYLFLYQKQTESNEKEIGNIAKNRRELLRTIEKARRDAETRLMGNIIEVDAGFRQAYQKMNGGYDWVHFNPLYISIVPGPDGDGKTVRADPAARVVTVSSAADVAELTPNSCDSVIVSYMLHKLSDSEREKLLADAINAIKPKGALIVRDEWNPPAGSEYPIAKHDFRGRVMETFRDVMSFEAALKEDIDPRYDKSKLYGYVYRKIR